jgi:hypothetical protein
MKFFNHHGFHILNHLVYFIDVEFAIDSHEISCPVITSMNWSPEMICRKTFTSEMEVSFCNTIVLQIFQSGLYLSVPDMIICWTGKDVKSFSWSEYCPFWFSFCKLWWDK